MLDFDITTLGADTGARTTQIRHGDRLADVIENAAAMLGVDKSMFCRNAIAKEAQRVMERSARHTLNAEDAAAFQAALDTPPPPTPRALSGKALYRDRVVHAD